MERFGIPGKTLLGSDSHTPAAGSLGMLAMGAGGLEVALAMVGEPYFLTMPKIWGIKLIGKLQDWVSAKDIILEMLRRHSVKGGVGYILEYYGEGLKELTAMDRHVIANMGAELGATTTVFPSDEEVKRFLESQGRVQDWKELVADGDATYDKYDEIDLSKLEPLIACPSSPDNVKTVREVAGRRIYQAMVGSSANPGFRDFAIAALIVDGKQVATGVSFDINPTSRQILEDLTQSGLLLKLVRSGGRIHQAGCNGCIGMGQAPATKKISLRTVSRNFPGRSGTKEDAVYLCSPETAAISALKGVITDPRDAGLPYPKVEVPTKASVNVSMLEPPSQQHVELEKGPNIKAIPQWEEFPEFLDGPVGIKVGNDISTDEILSAGTKVLPYRSNIPKISEFTFVQVDEDYYKRVLPYQNTGHFIVGGLNYGQGSSREHAAMAPRYLGVHAVFAKSFARIHWQNLVNFGILPLKFVDPYDYDLIDQGDILTIAEVKNALKNPEISVYNQTKRQNYRFTHGLTPRQIDILLAGGMINFFKKNE